MHPNRGHIPDLTTNIHNIIVDLSKNLLIKYHLISVINIFRNM